MSRTLMLGLAIGYVLGVVSFTLYSVAFHAGAL